MDIASGKMRASADSKKRYETTAANGPKCEERTVGEEGKQKRIASRDIHALIWRSLVTSTFSHVNESDFTADLR